MARENIFEGSSSQLVSLCASCNLIYLSSLLETAVGAGLKMRKSTKVNFKSFFLSLSFKKRELIRHFEEVGASATTSHSVFSLPPTLPACLLLLLSFILGKAQKIILEEEFFDSSQSTQAVRRGQLIDPGAGNAAMSPFLLDSSAFPRKLTREDLKTFTARLRLCFIFFCFILPRLLIESRIQLIISEYLDNFSLSHEVKRFSVITAVRDHCYSIPIVKTTTVRNTSSS